MGKKNGKNRRVPVWLRWVGGAVVAGGVVGGWALLSNRESRALAAR